MNEPNMATFQAMSFLSGMHPCHGYLQCITRNEPQSHQDYRVGLAAKRLGEQWWKGTQIGISGNRFYSQHNHAKRSSGLCLHGFKLSVCFGIWHPNKLLPVLKYCILMNTGNASNRILQTCKIGTLRDCQLCLPMFIHPHAGLCLYSLHYENVFSTSVSWHVAIYSILLL